MDRQKRRTAEEEIKERERIAQIEDPQENEVDMHMADERPPIDKVRLDMINMG
ncbi:MAG: hypothetical protein ACE3JP_14335 [Ectobacillus sp.]